MPDVETIEVDGIEGLEQVFGVIEADWFDFDYSELLESFIPKLEEKHAEHFEGQHDPSGLAWASLAASTIRRKGHNRILFETGRLGVSVIAESPDSIRDVISESLNHGLVFGEDVPYSHFLQDGTNRMPARKHVGINETTLTEFVDLIADDTVEKLKR